MGKKFHHMGQQPSYGTLVERNLFQVVFPGFLFFLRFLAEAVQTAFHFLAVKLFHRQHY